MKVSCFLKVKESINFIIKGIINDNADVIINKIFMYFTSWLQSD